MQQADDNGNVLADVLSGWKVNVHDMVTAILHTKSLRLVSTKTKMQEVNTAYALTAEAARKLARDLLDAADTMDALEEADKRSGPTRH